MKDDHYNQYFPDTPRFSPKQPKPNEEIFRVFSKWKLNDLLSKKSLFFCRLDKFWSSDPNEGLWTKNETNSWKNTDFDAQKFNQWNAKRFAVGCWSSIANKENLKLWECYNGGIDGVGIKSTTTKLNKVISDSLKKASGNNPSFFSAIVEYKNLEQDNLLDNENNYLPNMTLPIFRKNKNDFEYEKEIRFVIDAGHEEKQPWEIDEKGLFIPFSNFNWINSIIFDPRMEKKERGILKAQIENKINLLLSTEN